MIRQLLAIVLMTSSATSFFANDSKITDSSDTHKALRIILFIDLEKVKTKSIEWNYLQSQLDAIRNQLQIMSTLYFELDGGVATHIDRQKRDQHGRLIENAQKQCQLYREPLETAQEKFNEKLNFFIKEKAQELEANAVLSKQWCGLYIAPTNDITTLAIDTLNKQYQQQTDKAVYPICELSEFINKMKNIGSISLQ